MIYKIKSLLDSYYLKELFKNKFILFKKAGWVFYKNR